MATVNHIETTPGVCSGHPRIAGTRIRVQNVVLWTEQGETPDEIVAAYPQLSLADVYAALAHYHDNRVEMDRLIEHDQMAIGESSGDSSAPEGPSTPSGG